MKKNRYVSLISVMCFTGILPYGAPKGCYAGTNFLARFFSYKMELQRNKPIEFLGTASPATNFEIAFAGKKIVSAGIVGK